AEARASGDARGDQGRQDAARRSARAPVAAQRHADREDGLRRHREAGRVMRAATAVAAGLLGSGTAAHGGDRDQLSTESAQTPARVQQLESENARLRGETGGLAAALEQRATAAVAVAPGPAPGSTTTTTEAEMVTWGRDATGRGASEHVTATVPAAVL